MILTRTKLHKILKKYNLAHKQHNDEWKEVCRKARLKSTETRISLPTIYDHEKINSKGSQLFKDFINEFEGYEVFPKKKDKMGKSNEENLLEACQVASNMLEDLPTPDMGGKMTSQQRSRRNGLISSAKSVLKMAIDGKEVNP